jgi:hypothetical protein
MSSATSTEAVRPDRVAGGPGAPPAPASTHGEAGRAEAGVFRAWHLFVVVGMLAATAAVLLAGDNRATNLVLVSLSVVAAGFTGLAFHRTLWPLVSPEDDPWAVRGRARARQALEREKALVLRSIKELEFDRAMGKVAEADFTEMVARLRARAIGLMKQLDEEVPRHRELIERELRQRLADRRPPATSAATGPAAAVYCTQCGVRNDADAKFCKACGGRM